MVAGIDDAYEAAASMDCMMGGTITTSLEIWATRVWLAGERGGREVMHYIAWADAELYIQSMHYIAWRMLLSLYTEYALPLLGWMLLALYSGLYTRYIEMDVCIRMSAHVEDIYGILHWHDQDMSGLS